MSAALDQTHVPSPGNPVAACAQKLTRHGLKVFPCQQDKRPTCKWGELATNCPQSVPMLWRTYPGPLIGVVTGAASGFDVLDLDWGKGGDDFYQEHCTRLTGTRTHRTRSGGLHLLFKHREGMRNSASRIAPGVDVRADGGYVIWWPAEGLEIVDRSPAQQWPAWLVELSQPPLPPKADLERVEGGLRDADRYVQGAVRDAVRAIVSAPQGRRNDTLNAETYGLARFIPGGHLSTAQIAEAMAAAGLQAGLNQREIEKTIASALRARMGG
ncbi:bifunctional DNA primase/polymerase [Acetobacter sp. TBRC 12305]|uniref:Bifunctional DNA primase/polymerase n=1 Tax=Acetobacter garciniae TaxID=2817435 RepID=A0A939KP85_9PROT|nr:bifunctional DNA primase/polymerase [Acetobacter garciniae]MBO1323592.1 bifunctional DNA primase/polymerase [Acetobacter garciniae]MBX0343281.1 bifunctional DNA primase/polymerase [Acetobacter garciniae]